jgi:hypothetical protein
MTMKTIHPNSTSSVRSRERLRSRGAAMVESIVVISVFILFFVGMVYFRSLYTQKLRVQRLARAAAVAHAMGACNGNPLDRIKNDMQASASGSGAGRTAGDAPIKTPTSSDPKASGPLGQALGNQGVVGDPIAGVLIQAGAAGTRRDNAWSPPRGFSAKVGSYAYMSCGEDQHDGNAGGMLDYIKGVFTSKF